VQEQLDDVYTHQEVSQLRSAALKQFFQDMTEADQIQPWTQRKAARDAARHELLQRLGEFTEFRSNLRDRDAKIEAGLAVAEMIFYCGDFSAAMKSAEARLAHEGAPEQRALAYRLLIRAARGAGDGHATTEARKRFERELPGEARYSSAAALPFGPVVMAVELYESAQIRDDFAVRNSSNNELSESSARLRDEMRESARKTLLLRPPP
jgi:hypothetical protein